MNTSVMLKLGQMGNAYPIANLFGDSVGHRLPPVAGIVRRGIAPLLGAGEVGLRPVPSGIGPGPEPKRPDGIGQGFVLPSSASAKPLDTSTSMWSVLGIAGAVGVAVYLALR